jgi:hypothetical protein
MIGEDTTMITVAAAVAVVEVEASVPTFGVPSRLSALALMLVAAQM